MSTMTLWLAADKVHQSSTPTSFSWSQPVWRLGNVNLVFAGKYFKWMRSRDSNIFLWSTTSSSNTQRPSRLLHQRPAMIFSSSSSQRKQRKVFFQLSIEQILLLKRLIFQLETKPTAPALRLKLDYSFIARSTYKWELYFPRFYCLVGPASGSSRKTRRRRKSTKWTETGPIWLPSLQGECSLGLHMCQSQT